jgi:hypothetical protein
MEGDPVRLITATAVCLVLLTTAACSSDPQPAAPPTPTDSVSATSAAPEDAPETATETASPSTDALPELPDEAKKQTEAGAEAFVKYYFRTFNELGQVPKTGVLDEYAAPGCSACDSFALTIATLEADDRQAAGPFAETRVDRVTVAEEKAGLDVFLSQLGPEILDARGDVVEEGARQAETTLLVELIWLDDRWAIAGITPQAR